MLEQLFKTKDYLNSRETFAELLAALNYKIGAEVGVERGYFSDILLKCNPNLKLFCIDPWTPYFKVSQRRQDNLFAQARQRLDPYGNRIIYIKKTSMDALLDIADNSLDFVYIDAIHDLENVSKDITGWEKKVKSGGIVSGHDYVRLPRRNIGVIDVVDNFVETNGLELYVTKEDIPSFFWVKP